MSPYKNFISTGKMYLNSNGFLRFLLSAHIAVFALGGLLYLLGAFLINIGNFAGLAIYDAFVAVGSVLMWGGLLLSIFAEDPLTIVITTGSISIGALVAWIVMLARSFPFYFGPLFYFLAFGTISILMAIKAEKFVKMRAEAAARSAIPCPRCGAGIPKAAAFCPVCGAPNPMMQYAPPPAGQPYAPPAGQPYAPQYTPQTPPQYASPVPPQYAPPVPPQYAPPVPPQYAPPAPPQYTPPVPPTVGPIEEPAVPEEPTPAEADVKKCINCGAELPVNAVFCGKCGTKQ
jgi:ribosomal protein L40E